MNKYDEKYDIRFAKYEEIDEVMQFIDKHWKKGHIMSRNRKLFEHEFFIDGKVNFLIAKEKATGDIKGTYGFMPSSKNKNEMDIWGSIWKVLPNSMLLLGVEMFKRIKEYANVRAFLQIGANPKTTVQLMKTILDYDDVGKMKHFYCLSKRNEYKIAKIEHYEKFKENTSYQVKSIPFKNIDEVKNNYDFSCNESFLPYKDIWYVNHRFFDYPIYKYQVYGLFENASDKAEALLVCREQEYNGEKVLRIVDYIGKSNLFAGISTFLADNLKKYEYIDLYCYGFDTDFIEQAGMIELKYDDKNIIPNYFNPYLAENIDIWVGTPKGKGKAIFFKADGDQDRPN